MSPRTLVELDDARTAILSAARPLEHESVALGLAALGRVLGEDVTATHPVPAFDNSAMDGFAVRAPDLQGAGPSSPVTLRLVGESRAGHPAPVALQEGQAIAISTGAMLPQGADAVLRVEETRPGGEQAVQALSAPSSGTDVRRAGDDLLAGQTVLRAGTPIGPAELGVLASLGRSLMRCARRPRVSVLVTGDELLDLQEAPRAGAIRDTSSYSISALAQCGGAEVIWTGRAADEPQQTRQAVEQALDGADLAVVCGGVSVGAHDHVRPALAALGVQESFWGLALKPGSPAWFGRRDETLVFGLPGNPVSAMVTFVLLAGPALRTMLGHSEAEDRGEAIFGRDYAKPRGRAHAVRCRLVQREDGLHAEPTGPQGSHVLSSMLGADALAIVDSAAEGVRAGERVPIVHLREWMRS
jgi:molybdopterin molybdotransferase